MRPSAPCGVSSWSKVALVLLGLGGIGFWILVLAAVGGVPASLAASFVIGFFAAAHTTPGHMVVGKWRLLGVIHHEATASRSVAGGVLGCPLQRIVTPRSP